MKALVAIAVALLPAPALAQVSFDPPFTDNAVLQRDRAIPVRGSAAPGSTVTLSMDGSSATALADRNGHWRAELPARKAGGPYRLTARSGNTEAALKNVMVGDVWLCSGQSNMEFTLRHASNAETEVRQSHHPMLRLFNVPRQSSATPQRALATPTVWQPSSPASAADFSAACYIMGRDLQAHQNIAVGLIAASWGGSAIEEWISAKAFASLPHYRPQLELLEQYRTDPKRAHRQWSQWLVDWLGNRLSPLASAQWQPVEHFGFWEDWGGPLSQFDGIGYYRGHVMLTPAQAKAAELVLGSVDDIDVTRINGRMVGALQGWNAERRYAVPAGVLRPGKNLVEVTVIDTGGGGGIWGAGRFLAFADGTRIPIHQWEFTRGDPLDRTGIPVGMPWLGGSGRTTLFNGMIAPLGDYPLKGFAWYQGEANVADARGYARLLPLLIGDWRERFGTQPFLLVQLAGFGALASHPVDHPWAQLRDVQRRVADRDTQVGLASALDVGQVAEIHPTDKQTVGHRLALAARKIALGEPIVGRGPSPVSVERTSEGIAVRFAHGPLKLVAGGEAIGFELCDAQTKCRFVPGRLKTGDIVMLPGDEAARKVRYLWQASPLVNIYNETGLPASGFDLPIPSNASNAR